jgi:hypothetical protein
MAHIGYRWYMMIRWCAVVYNSIHGVQWCNGFLGNFPLERPLRRDFRHIIELGSPKIDEWMNEFPGEEYSSRV